MAKIDRRFSMSVPPEQAQAMFVRELWPELAKDGGFVLQKEEPGHLEFSDAVEAPELARDAAVFSGLNKALARRIHVAFAADDAGTTVSLTGHCEANIRDALERLGLPKHWPEIAGEPHD